MSIGVVSHRPVAQVALRSLSLALAQILALGLVNSAQGADITWGGNYRVEAVKIGNPELSSNNTDKSYLLHHMVLNPKIIATDGVTIYGRLDVLNSPTFGINSYGQVQSVAGDIIGNGPGNSTLSPGASATPSRGSDSNAYGTTQRAGGIAVTELYMSWAQEFGQLVVGRAPIQFGLGTVYSAGNGLFDHYITTKDMIGYKMVLGNLFVMPIKAKVSEGAFNTMEDVDDYMVHVQYDNPESDLSLGVMHDVHVVTAKDTPTGYLGGAGSTRAGSYKNTLTSLFISQKATNWLKSSIEADLYSGDAGVMSGTDNVSINAWAVAAEFAWLPQPGTKWSGVLKAGFVTGDDPGTKETYEGITLNRNYDIAMLMFNHPLGQGDLFRTGLVRDTTTSASNQIDTEAISNTLYIAPSLTYKTRDNLWYGMNFVYARLNKDPNGANANTGTNLGYEFDFSVSYKPMERFTWITELGALLPGDAWKGSSAQNYETKIPYGFTTKAAISF